MTFSNRKTMSIRLAVVDGKRVENTLDRIGDKGENAFNRIRRSTGPASAGLKTVDASAQALNSVLRQGAGLVAAYVSIAGAIRGISSIASTALAFEGITNATEAAAGSVKLAAEEMLFVENQAERLGLRLRETAASYAQLLAASKGTAIEGAQTREIFTAVSEASAVLRLSIDDTKGALKAINQIISKGKVQAEELRGQLGERVPGAFQLAARAMSLTTEELDDQLELGNIYADDFLPKFAAEIRKTYAEGVPKAARSAAAELNRFNNSVLEIERQIGAGGFLEGISEGLRGLTQTLRDPAVQAAAISLGESLGTAVEVSADALGFLISNADLAVTALGGLVIARVVASGMAVLTAATVGNAGLVIGLTMAATISKGFAAQLIIMEGASKLAAVAMLGLRGALLLVGGPVGVAVLAGIALFKLAQGHDAAKDAAQQHSGQLRTAREELDEFLQSSNALNNSLSNSDLENRLKAQIRNARNSIQEVRSQLVFDPVGGVFDRLFRSDEVSVELEQLRRQLLVGEIDAKTYAAALLDVAKRFPEFTDEAAEAKGQVVALIAAQKDLEKSLKNLDKLREERRERAAGKNKPIVPVDENPLSDKELKNIEKRAAELEAEKQALLRVVEARKQGEQALKSALTLNAQEQALRRLGLELNEKEGSKRAEKASQIKALVADIQGLKAAEKEQMKAVRDAEKEERKREKTVDDVRQKFSDLDDTLQGAIKRAKEWKTEALQGLDETAVGYDEFGAQVDAIFNNMIQEARDKDLQNSREWRDGVTRALKDVVDEATDLANQTENLFKNAFSNMEGALVDFVKTGKLDFKSLTDSIISDLIRMQIQASITAPLAGALNAFVGSFFGAPGAAAGSTTAPALAPAPTSVMVAHTGGVIGADSLASRSVSSAVFNGAAKFHSGGLVGGEVPIIAQRGETVFTPGQMSALGGALREKPQVNVAVNVQNNTNTATAEAEVTREPNGDLSLNVIIEQVEGSISRNISRGEGLAPNLERRYGLNPASGSFR